MKDVAGIPIPTTATEARKALEESDELRQLVFMVLAGFVVQYALARFS